MPTDGDGTNDEGKLAATASARPPPNNDTTEKRSLAMENEDDDGHKKSKKMRIDLSDVPAKSSILKGSGKSGSSKYQGVYLDKTKNKWKATLRIDGKQRHIGTYDNEEDAAADYARAVFKYAPKKLEQKQKAIDLAGIPAKPPILKVGGKSGSSKYQGVYLDKSSNKWMAQIMIEGKSQYLGRYDTEEEAAVDYALAVFKYKEGKTEVAHQQKKSTDVSEEPSVVLKGSKYETSQFKGVFARSCDGNGVGPQGMMGGAVGSMVPGSAMGMHPAFRRDGKKASTLMTGELSVPATSAIGVQRRPSSMPFSLDGAPAGVAATTTTTNGNSSNSFNASQEMPQLTESSANSSNTRCDIQRLHKENQLLKHSLMKTQAQNQYFRDLLFKARAQNQYFRDLLMKTQASAVVALGSADESANLSGEQSQS